MIEATVYELVYSWKDDWHKDYITSQADVFLMPEEYANEALECAKTHGLYTKRSDTLRLIKHKVKVVAQISDTNGLTRSEKLEEFKGRFWIVWEDGSLSFEARSCAPCVKDGMVLTDEGWQAVRQPAPAALSLIKSSIGSDGDDHDYPLTDLLDVVDIQNKKVIKSWRSPYRIYCGPEMTKMQLVMADGSVRDFYEYVVGYSEGYGMITSFDRVTAFRKAYRDLNAGLPLECLECGSVYDEPGHVDPSGMSCERC